MSHVKMFFFFPPKRYLNIRTKTAMKRKQQRKTTMRKAKNKKDLTKMLMQQMENLGNQGIKNHSAIPDIYQLLITLGGKKITLKPIKKKKVLSKISLKLSLT